MTQGGFFSVSKAGVHLRVKAKPGARKDAVLGVHGAELVIAVRAAAEKGKANAEIVKVLSRALKVSRGSVILKTGGSSAHKIFLLPPEAADVLEEMESER
ncbi:MAG: DUF167 domain-containing protein [Spirochaetia bacterium]|jgi:uncharacterized protein (TIGR00251 family)